LTLPIVSDIVYIVKRYRLLYDGRMKGYMTLEELAERLGLKSTGSLRVQIQRGSLRADRIGKRTFIISEDEAARYEREHKGKPGRRQIPLRRAADLAKQLQRALGLEGREVGTVEGNPYYDFRPFAPNVRDRDSLFAWLRQIECTETEFMQIITDAGRKGEPYDNIAVGMGGRICLWDVEHADYRIVGEFSSDTNPNSGSFIAVPRSDDEVPYVEGQFGDAGEAERQKKDGGKKSDG